jgi:phage-related baseplate assembly protein
MALFGFDSGVVPDIDFCQKDASVIESEIITNYEQYYNGVTKQNKTLARADPVRLLLLSIIYQFTVQRSIVDSTGKENLIKYSHGDDLDNIGALYGPERGSRLKPTYATTILRFTLANNVTLTADSIVPQDTLVQTGTGIQFATDQSVVITAGTTFADVSATAVEVGSAANGFVAGQINLLVQWSAPFLVMASNTITSGGGSNVESDDHYRARIWMAPESFSVAGPKEAYEYWAASANSNIIDVSVWSDATVAGQVYIYPLMTGGVLPDSNVIAQVYAKCNADDIRPLTDQVFVQAPTVNQVTANMEYWIDKANAQFEASIMGAVRAAFQDWITWQSSEIGLDIVPSKAIQMMIDAGAKRVVVTSPAFTIIDEKTLAVINPASVLTYGGLEQK